VAPKCINSGFAIVAGHKSLLPSIPQGCASWDAESYGIEREKFKAEGGQKSWGADLEINATRREPV
jgi:hypothetical protein